MIKKTLKVLEERFNIQSSTNNNESPIAFELLAISLLFNRSPYFAKDNCWMATKNNGKYSGHSNDGKMDGFDVISNKDTITIKLLQAKYSKKVKVNQIVNFLNAVKTHVMNTSSELPSSYEEIGRIRAKIEEAKNLYPSASLKYELFLAFKNINKKNMDTIIAQHNAIFQNNINVSLDIIDLNGLKTKFVKTKKLITDFAFNKVVYTIKLSQKVNDLTNENDSVFFSVISGEEVFGLINSEFKENIDLTRLFNGNVRGFLGDTVVNRAIKGTIEKAPQDFLRLNNGCVIVCDKIRLRDSNNNEYVLENPVLVNGQQTFASIYKYAKENDKKKILVPVKFIALSKDIDARIEQIAKASNQANTIDDLDLLSNKHLIKKLRKYFSDKGRFLKIKSGEILNDVYFKSVDYINFSELIKMWVSYELDSPHYGKTTKRNIKIFSDAYSYKKGYRKLLIEEENFDKLADSLNRALEVMDQMNEIEDAFKDTGYFSHAQYFICYLFKKEFKKINSEIIMTNSKHIKDIVNEQIKTEQQRKQKAGQEYTHNNYFKSSRPVQDYLETQKLRSIDDYINDLFSNA